MTIKINADTSSGLELESDTSGVIDIQSGGTTKMTVGTTIDVQGNELVLDADGDTSIHADTDDQIDFKTGGSDRMRIDSSGHLSVGKTGFSFDNVSGFSVAGSGSNEGQLHCITSGQECMKINRKDSNGNGLAFFRGSTNFVGAINFDTSSVSYNTSSDYRLKENVNYTWDATTRLKQLRPCRFNWIADDTDTALDGFLAHEVSTVVPEAITGEKDGVQMQGIDQSKLVPLLVKTIQELEARITALESE